MSERDPDQATPSADAPKNLAEGSAPSQPPSAAGDPSTGVENAAADVPAEATDTEVSGEEPGNRRARRAAAAQARKQRMREREDAQAVGLGAQELLDDAFVRSTDTAGKWLRKYSSTIQWIVVAGVAVWAGWGIYDWRQAKVEAQVSDALAEAARAQFGKVGTAETSDDELAELDPTPTFADDQARLSAAEAGFRAAAERDAATGTALYARLGLAGVLLDQQKYDEARAEFEKVAQAPAAQTEKDLLWRALEGVAQAQEGKGDKEAALAAYAKLAGEATGTYSLLARYNQARLQHALGRPDEAKSLVQALQNDLPPAQGLEAMFPGYLEQSVRSLASAIGVPPPERKPNMITPDQIRQLAEGLQAPPPSPANTGTTNPEESP